MTTALERAKAAAIKKQTTSLITDERILMFGGSGAGKSESYLSIAEALYQRGDDVKFYVLDTDKALAATLHRGYPHLANIFEWEYHRNYTDMRNYVLGVQERVRPQDWFVMDRVEKIWLALGNWFVKRVYGMEPDEYFIQVAADIEALKKKNEKLIAEAARTGKKPGKIKKGTGKEFGGFAGPEWQSLNRSWAAFQERAVLEMPCNVFACAGIKELSDSDPADLVAMYSGYRDDGHKKQAHDYHTVLQIRRGQKRRVYTISDRGDREELKQEVIEDRAFSEWYMERQGMI